MSDLNGRFVWYELMTNDPVAAKAFYAPILGWTYEDMSMAEMTYTVASITQPVAGIMPIPPDAKAMNIPPNWTGYVAVADCDATCARVTELGGKIMKAPQDIPNVGRFAICTDPQGAYFALLQGSGEPMDPKLMALGHIGWHELYTSDLEAGFAFYAALFGWTLLRDMDMGPEMGVYRVFGKDGADMGGMMTAPPQMPVSAWGYYFSVPDINEAQKTFTGGGGKVVNGPMEVPGPMWVFNGVDPQGAFVSMVGPQGG